MEVLQLMYYIIAMFVMIWIKSVVISYAWTIILIGEDSVGQIFDGEEPTPEEEIIPTGKYCAATIVLMLSGGKMIEL